MRFLLQLMCVCGVAVLAVDALQARLNLETYTANLRANQIKPEIIEAANITAELAHWLADTKAPQSLQFPGDDGKPQTGIISDEVTVVLQSNFANDVKFYFLPLFQKKKSNQSEPTLGKVDGRGIQMTRDNMKEVEKFWKSSLPLKVIIHGFTNTIASPAIQLVKEAYQSVGDYNIIGVDWGALCSAPNYLAARMNVPGAGAEVGQMLDKLIDAKMTQPSLIHIIGHSLGAHVAGIAGKSMTKGKAERITGLDPAGPLFVLTGKDGHIYKTDAKLVDIIHTNAGLLGKSAEMGHIDFYPNGGKWQVGCGPADVTGTCSHGRAYELFAATVKNKVPFVGYLCPKLPSDNVECARSRDSPATMGDQIMFSKPGRYFVEYTWPPQ